MSWTPSEGLKRADAVVREIEASQSAIFGTVGGFAPVFRYRVTQLIAQALDQALADGAEQDAIAAMVTGNGQTPYAVYPTGTRMEFHGQPPEGWASVELTKNGVVGVKLGDPVPPTADPAGLDLPDFPAPNAPVVVYADPATFKPADAEPGSIVMLTPKKRGRPKGSTNKAKKKAKAAKKAALPDLEVPAEAQVDPTAS